MITNLQAIVLAAGKSTRFQTGKTKLIEKLCGQPMILYPTRLLKDLAIPITIVVGYQKDIIIDMVHKYHGDTITFVPQTEQLGTGHAILCTRNTWNAEHILIMNGDMPLVTKHVINQLWEKHQETNAAISFVTAHNSDTRSKAYGRVIETDDSVEIIEAKEFTGEWHEHCCVNAGIYIVKKSFLEAHTTDLEASDKTHEFYITDLVRIASENNETIATTRASFDVIRGINTYQELWAAEQIKRSELIRHWMNNGVHFFAAQNVHIDLDVTIGAGTFVGAGTHLLGATTIGENCRIEAFTIVQDATLEDGAQILSHSVVCDATLKNNTSVGPFAHVHKNSTIEHNAAIGNFVEVARSTVGAGTKAKHHTYLGDATIGEKTNIGAGTITCNYNGSSKEKTFIGDNCFIGTNNSIIAPITIGDNAYTAAGSTITENVPADALAIARTRQSNKDGYAHKIRAKISKPSHTKKSIGQQKKQEPFSFMGAIKTDNDTTPNAE